MTRVRTRKAAHAAQPPGTEQSGPVFDRAVRLAAAMAVDDDQVILSSAADGTGRDELASAIEVLLAAPPWRRSAL